MLLDGVTDSLLTDSLSFRVPTHVQSSITHQRVLPHHAFDKINVSRIGPYRLAFLLDDNRHTAFILFITSLSASVFRSPASTTRACG